MEESHPMGRHIRTTAGSSGPDPSDTFVLIVGPYRSRGHVPAELKDQTPS
jgi:hypothetical protein